MLRMSILVLTYAIAPVAVGHGVAPFAMVLSAFPLWGQVLQWGAVVAIGGSFLARPDSPPRLIAQLAGAVMIYSAWLINVLHVNQFNSEGEQDIALASMLLFSLPFQATIVWVLFALARQLRRLRDQSGT